MSTGLLLSCSHVPIPGMHKRPSAFFGTDKNVCPSGREMTFGLLAQVPVVLGF